MANNKKPNILRSTISILSTMQSMLDNIKKDTYKSPDLNNKDMDNIVSSLSKNIDDIITNSYGDNSISSVSKMISRIDSSGGDNINKSLEEALERLEGKGNVNIFDLYTQNLWIKKFDKEVDTVIKYMPRLKEALSCLKDCVLSADHFSKEYLKFKSNNIKNDQLTNFYRNIEYIKDRYDMNYLYEKIYNNTSYYGETFVYIVPYKKEIAKLLNRKSNISNSNVKMPFIESVYINESSIDEEDKELTTIFKDNNINISINIESGCISSIYKDYALIEEAYESKNYKSFTEQYSEILNETSNEKLDKLIPDDFSIPDDVNDAYRSKSSDGLITTNKKITPDQLHIQGCIVKILERSNIIIIHINGIVIGYLYFEFTNESHVDNIMSKARSIGADTVSPFMRNEYNRENDNNDRLLSYISNTISKSIDKNFVNANQDLAEEIYMILKHNDLFNDPSRMAGLDVKVTFIPVDDIEHVYFEKDEKTQRGISDLNLSLFPAMLYISLYINDTINNLVRGQDKRVIYVKQSVDRNISATLLNVLNQVKKGNYGIRQMENINTMLNMIGQYNDFLIPVNGSNDPAIQFEVMPGMKVDLDTELMDRLEKMAINPTDVPIEVIENRQSLDFAIQATMTNSKLMRKTYKRQNKLQKSFSRISTKIYNYENDENVEVKVQLPAPAFLNITNANNLYSTVDQFVESIINIVAYDQPDEVRSEFKKLATDYYVSSQIDIETLENIKERAILNIRSKSKKEE